MTMTNQIENTKRKYKKETSGNFGVEKYSTKNEKFQQRYSTANLS